MNVPDYLAADMNAATTALARAVARCSPDGAPPVVTLDADTFGAMVALLRPLAPYSTTLRGNPGEFKFNGCSIRCARRTG